MKHQWASIHELAQLGLFATLPGEQLGALAGQMHRMTLGPGDRVELDDDEALFVLVGMATAVGPDARQRALQAGAWIARAATVRALTPVTAFRCRRSACEALVGELPREA